jgi:hypothetical protein
VGMAKRIRDSRVAPPTPNELLAMALDSTRRQLTLETTYTHDAVVAFVAGALPGWEVHGPGIMRERALSQWPACAGPVATWLTDQGYKEDPHVLIDGSCVPLAVLASKHACDLLVAGTCPNEEVPDELHATARQQLSVSPNAAEIVYGGMKRNEWLKGPRLWAIGSSPDTFLADFMHGTKEASANLTREAGALMDRNSKSTEIRFAIIPLFLPTYIFDADELDLDLEEKNEIEETSGTVGEENETEEKNEPETAQYSCHCLGVVLDAHTRVVVLADPNGGLVPGYNMEFVCMPPRVRRAKPSTCKSRWDLDQRIPAKRQKPPPTRTMV